MKPSPWLYRVIHEACTQGRIIGRDVGMSAGEHNALVGKVLARVGPDNADRTREPAALRNAAEQLDATAGLYDGDSPAHELVRQVLMGEARRLRSLATREERRRTGR